jgi:DNA-binding MarR family transcriptional regulator
VSLLVRRLLEQGEIERKRNQSDQRVWCISLTDHGRDLLARTLPVVEAFDAEFFQASKEDNELSKPLIAD